MGPQGCRNLRTPQPGHSVPLVILDTVARLPLSIPKAYNNEENPYATTWREGVNRFRSGVCRPYRQGMTSTSPTAGAPRKLGGGDTELCLTSAVRTTEEALWARECSTGEAHQECRSLRTP